MQSSLQNITDKKLDLECKWRIGQCDSIVGHQYVYALLFNKATITHYLNLLHKLRQVVVTM